MVKYVKILNVCSECLMQFPRNCDSLPLRGEQLNDVNSHQTCTKQLKQTNASTLPIFLTTMLRTKNSLKVLVF